MIINNNIGAMNAHRQMGANQEAQGNSMEKLSSGLRINNASDDAAGLAISEKMRGQIRGLEQADRNAQDGVSMIQTAEGALNETHDILQRMRELATQAANDTNTETDRGEIQKEVDSLSSEINRIGNSTEFNTQKLLNGEKSGEAVQGEYSFEFSEIGADAEVEVAGSTLTQGATEDFETAGEFVTAFNTDNSNYEASEDNGTITLTQAEGSESADAPETSGVGELTTVKGGNEEGESGLNFQIGANNDQNLTLEISDMRSAALGITATEAGEDGFSGTGNVTNEDASEFSLDVSSHEGASNAIETIQSAIDQVSAERSQLGANQNRLEHTINNLGTSAENLQSAESRIRDVDMAKEMMDNTKNNILSQASQSMLAQANQQPQQVLQLLQ